LRERRDDLVRRHGPVAVDEVVQVAGGEARPFRKRAVRRPRVVHERLDGAPELVSGDPPPARHQAPLTRPATSSTVTRSSARPSRVSTSTLPSSSVFFPTVTRWGAPIRSASANFSPG